MKVPPAPTPSPFKTWAERLFPAFFGGFLGLALVKFGNPPIMEKWVNTPGNIYEVLLGYPWPMTWAWSLLGLVLLLGLIAAKWRTQVPTWLLVLPLVWVGWSALAATQSVEPDLSKITVKHFFACICCFYLGVFSLSRAKRMAWFWAGLLIGFVLVLIVGWEQRFGGLEDTRRYFYLYIYPTLKEIPPGYLKKITSNRIWATLFYPNALAGAILLLLPAMLAVVWSWRPRFTRAAMVFLLCLAASAALACLFWSGSKGGWLLLLLMALVMLLMLPWNRRLKAALVSGVLVIGLAGFFWKYASFFEKGATSVSARFDYWQAALQTAKEHPLLGTGPGTFAVAYEKVKRPESEMSRLVHNDYLEQASDSGLIALLAYAVFIAASLAEVFGRVARPFRQGKSLLPGEWLLFAVWVGLLGWALQGLLEFGLYIPALAWPSFALLGWLLASSRLAPGRSLESNRHVQPSRVASVSE